MSLLDIFGRVADKAVRDYSAKQNEVIRTSERKINEYSSRGNLSSAQKQKIDQARQNIDKMKANTEKAESLKYNVNQGVSNAKSATNALFNLMSNQSNSNNSYGGKTVDEWDREWISIGKLKTANLTPYNHSVGLYRHVVDGQTMYVGRAVEWNNGGFRKRLSDYRRDSDSARVHTSGQVINANLDKIETYLLITGSDKQASDVACQLEGKMIGKYNPPWNKQRNI